MTEIKFRAWDNGKMYYADSKQFGFQFRSDGEWVFCDFGMQCVYARSTTGKLMQYTGLKDKNGKEIYEGDIVKYATDTADKGNIMKGIRKSEVKNNNQYSYSPWWYSIVIDPEVIGNIYENEELLNQ